MNWLGHTRQKVSEYVDFIELELGVLLLTHIMAVVWIAIGLDSSVEGSWVNAFIEEQRELTGDPNVDEYTYMWVIYFNAFYFILTTITTVGYGDIKGFTTMEYLYQILIEMIGIGFYGYMIGTFQNLFASI